MIDPLELRARERLAAHIAQNDAIERGQLGHRRRKSADAINGRRFGDSHELPATARRDEHYALNVLVFRERLFEVAERSAELHAISDAHLAQRLSASFDIEHADFR